MNNLLINVSVVVRRAELQPQVPAAIPTQPNAQCQLPLLTPRIVNDAPAPQIQLPARRARKLEWRRQEQQNGHNGQPVLRKNVLVPRTADVGGPLTRGYDSYRPASRWKHPCGFGNPQGPDPPRLGAKRYVMPPIQDTISSRAAAGASILLDRFSRTNPGVDGKFSAADKKLVDNALTSILQIQKELRLIDAIDGSTVLPRPQLDGGGVCIICYETVADTLLLPCKHLVLCTVWLSNDLVSRCPR